MSIFAHGNSELLPSPSKSAPGPPRHRADGGEFSSANCEQVDQVCRQSSSDSRTLLASKRVERSGKALEVSEKATRAFDSEAGSPVAQNTATVEPSRRALEQEQERYASRLVAIAAMASTIDSWISELDQAIAESVDTGSSGALFVLREALWSAGTSTRFLNMLFTRSRMESCLCRVGFPSLWHSWQGNAMR